MSRRALIAHTLLAGSFLASSKSVAQTPAAIRPIALDGGIEVRDYRIFPTLDVTRFLVEIHNTADDPVDAPVVGVVLNQLPAGEGFGVAAPSIRVLQPNASAVLVGTAPLGLQDDGNWDSPDWYLCDELSTEQSGIVSELPLSLSYSLNPVEPKNLNIMVEVFNHSEERVNRFRVGGGVFDAYGRPCGVVPPLIPSVVHPGQSEIFPIDIWGSRDYIGNPFVFDVVAQELTVEISLQPVPIDTQPLRCPVVMPWNQ